MAHKNIDLALLRTLVLIVDNGTFHNAALIANRTQSAISQQIQRLEEELGFPLFDRIGRNKQITKEGSAIYQSAKLLLGLNDALYTQADSLKELVKANQGSAV
jgi:DNA-binding transcriptional LysR family regulator